jgi:flagellar basal-body rod modification protein FlgD
MCFSSGLERTNDFTVDPIRNWHERSEHTSLSKERTQMTIQGTHSNIIPMAATSAGSSNSTGSTSSSSSATGSSSTSNQLTQSDFLKLIATELQAQDPTNPLDPSQFMGQLVQFSTLDQVTGIYNILSQGAAASSAPAASGSSTGASAASTPASQSTSSAVQGL